MEIAIAEHAAVMDFGETRPDKALQLTRGSGGSKPGR